MKQKVNSKILVFFGFLVTLGCNSIKRVPQGDYLLSRNIVLINGKKEKFSTFNQLFYQDINELDALFYQKPNSKFFGIPIKLGMYNISDSIPAKHYERWLDRKEKSRERTYNFLSEKQVYLLKKSYISFNKFLRELGEAPVILSEDKIKKTVKNIKEYYNSNGYWDSKITYEIDTLPKKRSQVTYRISTKTPYIINSLSKKIESPQVAKFYNQTSDKSLINVGDIYKRDNLEKERERILNLCRNYGLYTFQKNTINFEVEVDTLSKKDKKIDITVVISNLASRKGDSVIIDDYKVHKIEEVNIYLGNINDVTSNSFNKMLTYENYNIYYKDKPKFKPKVLRDVIAINKGDVYSDYARNKTYKQLSNFSVLQFANIDYKYNKDSLFYSNIYLFPKKRFFFQSSTNATNSIIQNFGVTFNNSILARNLFKSGEVLDFSPRFNIGIQGSESAENNKLIYEYGGDINLKFPRIFFPVNTDRIIHRDMSPQTQISLGIGFQKNIGLDKQSIRGKIRYSWRPSSRKKYSVDLFNVQYIQNLNTDNYYQLYQSTYNLINLLKDKYPNLTSPEDLITIKNQDGEQISNLTIPNGVNNFLKKVANEGNLDDRLPAENFIRRQERLTQNNLILGLNFSLTFNNREGLLDNNFYQLSTTLETSGNIVGLFSNSLNLDKNNQGQNLLGGIPYSQYTKVNLDFIKYFNLGSNNIFIIRTLLGIAAPYGNSNNIPFLKSYFAGGANDNRGWLAYSLGPGRNSTILDFNEANLKIASNLEYRFTLLGNLKGALFGDLGNIWNIWNNITDEKTVFKGLSSLEELALSTGLGFRYDFGFLVARLDLGLKTYNPALSKEQRWFSQYNFNQITYNIAINYPF